MKKQVCVTGASGFVGTNLVPYLMKDGYSVSKLSIRQNTDFTLPSSDAVIHLAGKAHDLKKTASPEAYYEANTELTKKIFDAFLQSKAEIFVFVSSVKAVADSIEGSLTETQPASPLTHYGRSKLEAEKYLLKTPVPQTKRVFILRPCMIHGPGNKGNLNLLYNIVSKGFAWPLGSFENRRSFCSIENFCFVIGELLKRVDIPTGIYNVADDIPVSTNDLIRIISECQNMVPRILNLPKQLLRTIAYIGDYLHLPLNSERLQKTTESYVASNNKLVSVLGKNLPVSAVDGLKKTMLSFRHAK